MKNQKNELKKSVQISPIHVIRVPKKDPSGAIKIRKNLYKS